MGSTPHQPRKHQPAPSSQPPTKAKRVKNWRDYPDQWVAADSIVTAPSLRPNADTIWLVCLGDVRSKAIVDSYQCRYPVTVVDHIEDGGYIYG